MPCKVYWPFLDQTHPLQVTKPPLQTQCYCTIFYEGEGGGGDDEIEEDNNEGDEDDDEEDAEVEKYLEGDEDDDDEKEEVEEYPEGDEDPLPCCVPIPPAP